VINYLAFPDKAGLSGARPDEGIMKQKQYKLVKCCCCAKTFYPDYSHTTGTLYEKKYWCSECWLKLVYVVKG